MSRHAPKLFAIEAAERGLLSPAGRARLEGHVTACDVCKRAREAVRSYEAMRGAARDDVAPEPSWERLARALDGPSGAANKPANGRLIALAWPILAVAATVVIAWVGISGQRDEAQRATGPQRESTPAEIAAAPRGEGWVTLSSNSVPSGPWVHEGDVLRTDAKGELHAALGNGAAIILGPDSQLLVARLRPGETRLVLERGTVFNRVHKLAAGEHYGVRTGEIDAEVLGTRFTVASRDSVQVWVYEGSVGVQRAGALVARLEAGQHWDSAAPASTAAPSELSDRIVHAAELETRDWPTLRLPATSAVLAYQVDGTRMAAPAGLSMRAPIGKATLEFEDTKHRMHTISVDVRPEGGALDESAILALLAGPQGGVGFLAPEQISPVVQGGLDSLRRCYERALRQNPRLESKLVLLLRVAPDGHVARAELEAHAEEGEVPESLQGCVLGEARVWRFPRPDGGPVALEVPLNFRAKR